MGRSVKFYDWENEFFLDYLKRYNEGIAPKNASETLRKDINEIHIAENTGVQRTMPSIHSHLHELRRSKVKADGKRDAIQYPKPDSTPSVSSTNKSMLSFGKPMGENKVKKIPSNVKVIFDMISGLAQENADMKKELRKLRAVRDAVESYQRGV